MMFIQRSKIISVQRIIVDKRYGYRYLKEIMVKRADQKEYMFTNQNDIEDLYLLKIQDKIHNLVGIDEFDLTNAQLLYIRRVMIKKRVEDAQLGVESYQTKLNLIKPQFMIGSLHHKVYDKLDVMVRDNRLGYENKGMKDREWTKKDKERTWSIPEKIEKTLKERRRMRRLDCFVGERRNETDYILLVRPE
ncbi:hypothetical protein Tco_1562832 [Tanacetum coccineum]